MYYCSKECQAEDWKEGQHLVECEIFQVSDRESSFLFPTLLFSVPNARGAEEDEDRWGLLGSVRHEDGCADDSEETSRSR